MKVLYIVTAYPRFPGDVITPWLVETVKRLKNQGIDITIFAPSYKGLKDQVIDGIPVKRFRYFFKFKEDLSHDETVPDRVGRSFWYKLIALAYMFMGTLAIIKYCLKEKFDVIHVHWPVPHAVFGYAGKKVSGARLILSFYGVELRWVKKKMPFLRSFLKWSLNRADVITCISAHTRNEITDFSTKPVTIIPFGAGLDIEEKGSVPASPPEILFVGRLVERKGVKYLIEAFKILADQRPCKLCIVGDGPEKPHLENQVKALGLKDEVVLTGKISDKELQKRYQNCSVSVLPAITDSKGDTEGLGVVLIESLSYKRPVVASGVGGIVDIVLDGKTGLLVPEKDSQALSRALEKLLSDGNLYQRLAEQGYQYVREKFSWDRIIEQILETYRN